MSTFMANPQTVVRKWYVIDAAAKPMGRVAAVAAALLRGKHKTDFTPHVDCGDCIVILNADKVILTGKKLEQKMYRRHSGWIGGLKEMKYSKLMQTRPELAFELAVKRMLPANHIGRSSLKRLHVYSGDAHPHEAQLPDVWEIK